MKSIKLGLEAIETSDEYKFLLKDSSSFNFKDCGSNNLLEINIPGFGWKEFHVEPYFFKSFNSVDLGLQLDNCKDYYILPDGIWKINYMLDQDRQTAELFYHLRNTIQLNCFKKILCKLELDQFRLSRKTYLEELNKISPIYFKIMASKFLVENEGKIEEGVQLYDEVNYLLKPFKNECGC